jgi:methyltransferase-like protein/2-polyprenyl-3-methyl-5-hydroxy-6-metoxy-1,4-benzoquinol methylase
MTQVQSPIDTVSVPPAVALGCSYDEIPYPSYPVAASHPDRLYSVARLFGLKPVPPERARILEIGCAGGGNLLPVASQFPNSTCVGIELSKVQVDDAVIANKLIGLKNVQIKQGSVTDITPEFGKFDYIICHGVFSWVPEFVREAILKVSSQNLSENGVAYISYNTMPGWYFRGMIREMLLRHVRDIKSPLKKIEQARALLGFLVEANQNRSTPHATYLRGEAEFLAKQPDTYLYHEHLEEYNNAFFFEDFIADATKHGLQYLGESNLSVMWNGTLPAETKEKLDSIGDPIKSAHYADCIAGRTFRQTLLVHQGQTISRNLGRDNIEGMRVLGRFTPVDPVMEHSSSNAPRMKSYKALGEQIMTTSQPISHAIMESIGAAYPASLSIDELYSEMEKRAKSDLQSGNFQKNDLMATMVEWMLAGYVDFRFDGDRLTTKMVGNPTVTTWARTQARANTLVTNLRHEIMTVSETHRQVIPFLDGTRDINGLANEIKLLISLGLLDINIKTDRPDIAAKDLPLCIAKQIVWDLGKIGLLLSQPAA